MSISSIFTELDIIRDGLELPGSTAPSSTGNEIQPLETYVSEASVLLAERQVEKEKRVAPICIAQARGATSSHSMDHIANTTVDAPTYWKLNGQGKKQKTKAFKSAPMISKKNRSKLEKAENYTERLQTKHSKWETRTNKKSKALKLA